MPTVATCIWSFSCTQPFPLFLFTYGVETSLKAFPATRPSKIHSRLICTLLCTWFNSRYKFPTCTRCIACLDFTQNYCPGSSSTGGRSFFINQRSPFINPPRPFVAVGRSR